MGVLKGLRVLEFEAIGPAPFCGMMLSDMGADVLRIDRPEQPADLGLKRDRRFDLLKRGRRSVTLDLKREGAVQAALELIARADVLIEGFRPGVMERLGLGPEPALLRNPRLVYGRMTGWGQHGPLAQSVGHDINYIARAGVLDAIGPAGGRPAPPLNLVGDFGGGAMLLAVGILGAIFQVQRSGQGQVVDAAVSDGAALLATPFWGMLAAGEWREQRGANLLDGGAPWYGTYECKDGRHVAVGAIERRFYLALVEGLGLAPESLPDQYDRERWPEVRRRFEAVFRSRTRDQWCAVFDGGDGCVSPVLTLTEAAGDEHHRSRGSFARIDGVVQPAPAPRFSITPSDIPAAAPGRGDGGRQALVDWGLQAGEIERLRDLGAGFVEGA